MAHVIVKSAPDRDQYLIWSTNLDDALEVGTRTQILDLLILEDSQNPDRAEEAIARADENGSSDRIHKFAWWGSPPFVVRHDGLPDNGFHYLRRSDVPAFADAIQRGDHDAARALLRLDPASVEDEDDDE